jgi:hypothetical protein
VPDQVHRVGPERVGQRDHVVAEGGPGVVGRITGAGGLVLAAHVDRHHPAAGAGEGLQHRQEVLLAAGVARHQQGGTALGNARAG